MGLRDFSRPENIGGRARQLKEGGFLIFKIKIGQQDHQKDMAVREAVGNDAFIGVDGNAAYFFVDARFVLNELSRFHIIDAEHLIRVAWGEHRVPQGYVFSDFWFISAACSAHTRELSSMYFANVAFFPQGSQSAESGAK